MAETPSPPHATQRLLRALGLHRPELRAWALYDPASAVVLDVLVTAVFPLHYATFVAADLSPGAATERYALLTTATVGLLATLAPALGALADAARARKRMLGLFVAIGAPAVALLGAVGRGDAVLAGALFLVANLGLEGASLFHGALLPHVATEEELDRTSTTACAAGYVAAGLALLAVLWAVERSPSAGLGAAGIGAARSPSPARVAFAAAAAWWIALSIPLWRSVNERGAGTRAARGRRPPLAQTWRALREHPQALRLAVAMLLYGSGVGTITRMAVIYGSELGVGSAALLAAIVVVDLLGTPCAFLFVAIVPRTGPKCAILLGLAGYGLAASLAYFARSAGDFLALALVIAAVQGGTQALGRSLFASLLPVQRSAEFFGLLSLASNGAAVVGPGLFAATAAASGSSRSAILSVVGLFVLGAAVLSGVDVEEGRRVARRVRAPAEPARS